MISSEEWGAGLEMLTVQDLTRLGDVQARALGDSAKKKPSIGGHLQPPTFRGFQPLASPNETPRPPYQWSLRGANGLAGPRTVGGNGGSTRVPGATK